MQRRFGRTAVLAVTTALMVSAADAQETRLLFTTVSSPQAETVSGLYQPWTDGVNAAGKGVVHIELRPGFTLVNSNNFYDRVLEDVVQISFGNMTYIGGRFPLSEVMGLPFLANTAEEASVAFWRLYKAGLLSTEFNDIVPLFAIGFPQQSVHLTKPLASLESLAGRKTIASSRSTSTLIARLGGAPLSIAASDTYAALQRGAADGVMFPWAGVANLKLHEVTTFHIDTSLGGGPGLVFMARKKYDALQPAVRKILDNNSGEAQSRRAGAFFDAYQARTLAALKNSGGRTIIALNDGQAGAWKTLTAPMVEEWTRETRGGAQTLHAFQEELTKIRSGK